METFGAADVWLTKRSRAGIMKEQKPTDNTVQGEGDYRAARDYKRDIENFVQKKGNDIPDLAKDAEKAIEGPEAAELEKAEQKGKSKARR